MAITKTKMLIEISENINTIATAVQLDANSRYLDVYLYDKGVPIDLTEQVVRINVRKPDGTTIFNQGEITDAPAGRCQFALTSDMLSEPAKHLEAQISIWNSDTEILSTNTFKILVSESLRNDEEVEATNEFGVLVVLFTEIQSALELMKEMTDTFGEPSEMAAGYGVNTFWGMLEHLAAGADVETALKTYINSTMGTENFVSLDSILLNSIVPAIQALNTIATTGGIPIVKSVQRGNTSGTSVTISAVNPDKCIVLVNNMYAAVEAVCGAEEEVTNGFETSGIAVMGRATALTATKLTLTANKTYEVKTGLSDSFAGWEAVNGTVSWQVIEFY